MSKFLSTAVAAAAMLLASPALAQMHGGHGPGGGGGGGGGVHAQARGSGDFHGRDFGRLSAGDRAFWAGGQWRHSWHNGVFGWWWFLDDYWYWYPYAVWPYPTYIGAAEVDEGAPPPPGAPSFWYRCANPAGFYPYVPACPGGWQQVPATPPDMNAGPPMAPSAPPPPGS